MSDTAPTTDKGTASTIIFFVITIIFFIAKYIFVDRKFNVDAFKYIMNMDNAPKPGKKGALDAVMTIAYFAIIIIIQISINTQTIIAKCKGYSQPTSVLFSTTIVPNILILGLIYFILTLIPSWKYPFSYVFGFVSSKLRKAWESLRRSPNEEEKKRDGNGNTSFLMKVWVKAFGTESTKFIKKITRENFMDFLQKSFSTGGLLQKPGDEDLKVMETIGKHENDIEYVTAYDVDARKKYIKTKGDKGDINNFKDLEKKYNNIKLLYQYVMKKDMIATCIWFLLAGFLVINVTQDTISSIECQFNADQLREISERQSA